MADTSKLVVGILPCTYHCMKKNDNFEALAKKKYLEKQNLYA